MKSKTAVVFHLSEEFKQSSSEGFNSMLLNLRTVLDTVNCRVQYDNPLIKEQIDLKELIKFKVVDNAYKDVTRSLLNLKEYDGNINVSCYTILLPDPLDHEEPPYTENLNSPFVYITDAVRHTNLSINSIIWKNRTLKDVSSVHGKFNLGLTQNEKLDAYSKLHFIKSKTPLNQHLSDIRAIKLIREPKDDNLFYYTVE